MATFVDRGRLSPSRWAYLHSTRPAQVWGLYPEKGSLRVGTDADFTVVDLDEKWTFDRRTQRSKSTVSPFDGESFVGRVAMTVVRGSIVYDGDEVRVPAGYGSLVESTSTQPGPRHRL